MHILVTNDDGYLAPGIRILADALSALARVTIVAPDRNCSGASNSLTLMKPLRVDRIEDNLYRVDGTPTDCVHLALSGLLEKMPDMVVSGINAGPNLGDDVLYSGTVAAAMEGRYLGLPAIAVSQDRAPCEFYQTAAEVVCRVVARLIVHPLSDDVLLNINVPDLSQADLQGIQATRLGFRHRAEPMTRQQDPYGRPIYWVGPPGEAEDGGEGTDFFAVQQGFASVTPMQVDLTRHRGVEPLQHWLNTL